MRPAIFATLIGACACGSIPTDDPECVRVDGYWRGTYFVEHEEGPACRGDWIDYTPLRFGVHDDPSITDCSIASQVLDAGGGCVYDPMIQCHIDSDYSHAVFGYDLRVMDPTQIRGTATKTERRDDDGSLVCDGVYTVSFLEFVHGSAILPQ